MSVLPIAIDSTGRLQRRVQVSLESRDSTRLAGPIAGPLPSVLSAEAETNVTYSVTSDGSIVRVGLDGEFVAAPAIIGVPTIDNTSPTEGDVLTATPATATGTPPPATSWQWERAGVEIVGANAITYTTVNADVGAEMTVVQVEGNVAGFAAAESTPTNTVLASGGGGLLISGTETEGETLTVSGGVGPYGWLRTSDSALLGTGASYTLTASEVGETLTVIDQGGPATPVMTGVIGAA